MIGTSLLYFRHDCRPSLFSSLRDYCSVVVHRGRNLGLLIQIDFIYHICVEQLTTTWLKVIKTKTFNDFP